MVADYDVITYKRPDGVTVNLSAPPYMLTGYDGFGISEFEDTFVSPPGAHGAYWYDTRMSAKVVTINFVVHEVGVVERQSRDRDLIGAFNPLLGPGVLRIDKVNGVSRELTCKLAESFSMPEDNSLGVGTKEYTVRFKSHGIPALVDPTLQTVNPNSVGAAVVTFPWSFPRVWAQSGYYTSFVINNPGDISTPVTITLTGPFISPSFINNTTGQTISMPGLTVSAGVPLEIVTNIDTMSVKVGGVDAWSYIDKAEFWELAIGVNSITFDVGGTDLTTTSLMSWYNRYLGV